MTRRRWLSALPVAALALLCVAMGAVLAARLSVPVMPDMTVAGGTDRGTSASGPPPLPQFDPPPEQRYTAVVSRNIFSVDRTPPPLPEKGGAEAAQALEWSLLGVITARERRIAIIHDDKQGENHNLSEGERHRGWELSRIGPFTATFTRGAEQETLTVPFASDAAAGSSGPSARILSGDRMPILPSRADAQGNPVRAQNQQRWRQQVDNPHRN